MCRIWLHRNKSVIFTAGFLWAAAIICFCLFISLLCGWKLNYRTVVKSQHGHDTTASSETRVRNSHVHRVHTHTRTDYCHYNQSLPAFLLIACRGGKKRERRSQSSTERNNKVRIYLITAKSVASGQVWEQQQLLALLWCERGLPPCPPPPKSLAQVGAPSWCTTAKGNKPPKNGYGGKFSLISEGGRGGLIKTRQMGGKTEGKDCFPLCQGGVGTRVVPTSITTTATLICCHPNSTRSARLACGSVADGLSITGGCYWCLGATLSQSGRRHIITHHIFTILPRKHITHAHVTKSFWQPVRKNSRTPNCKLHSLLSACSKCGGRVPVVVFTRWESKLSYCY